MSLTTIGFDADDTLWQNETFFRLTEEHMLALLQDYAPRDTLESRLLDAERRNITHYGYGVKGFTLSAIETAIEVTEGRVPSKVIAEIMEAGRDLLSHPLELLPHARETVEALSQTHRLVLITKGDLLHQGRKIAQSGLGDLFHAVEIVAEKDAGTYERIFRRYGDGAARALMAGNSLKSDVLPALEAGAHGVYVPHGVTWALEAAEAPTDHPRYRELSDLSGLVDLALSL